VVNPRARHGHSKRKVKAVSRIARTSSLLYLAAVIGLIAGMFLPSPAAKALSSYITASGTSLMLNGQPFQYIGFNTGMEGVCWDGNDWSTAEMDAYFSKLPANGITRIFAVQNSGTSIVSQAVTEAAKYNQHLILALSDGNSNCDDTDGAPSGAGSGKTLAYYQSGWQGNYLTWVNTIVPMFANNPTIAMWEVANEPFHTGATNVPLATMEEYVSGTAAAVRADDPNHLISVAPADTGDLGGAANYTAVMNDPNINVLDFHDYAWDYENGAEVSSNFAQVQSASQQLNKPFMVDEAGVEAGANCTATPGSSNAGLTLQGRVTYLITKANNYLSNGASGIAFWDYEQDEFSSCSYEMLPPNDPMISAVQNYGGGGSSAAPAVVTGSASGVTASAATLNGTVNPEGVATTYQFQYGTSTSYGSVAPASPASAGSGSSAVSESASLSGLSASTTYDYRLVATNATGTTDGSNQTFTTPASSSSGSAFTPVGALIQGTSLTPSVTAQAAGDVILLHVTTEGGAPPTGISGGGATWTQLGSTLTGSVNSGFSAAVYEGTVTAAGTATATVTTSGTPSAVRIAGQEYNPGSGQTGVLVSQANLDVTGTSTGPSITPTGSNELYSFYGYDTDIGSAGSTAGYTYEVDDNGNVYAYDPASPTQPPAFGDSNVAFGIAVLMQSASAPAQQQAPVLSNGHVVSGTLLPTRAEVAWNSTVIPGTWKVTINGPGFNHVSNTIFINQAGYTGLQSGHTYTVTVQQLDSGGNPWGNPGVIDFVTP
jgi:hypothetical protein